ncbi:MAG: hypothetical protein IJQ33_05505 [Clostridia bacterium]|nr:hypothetical protein [Clostridia bacterium]
MKSAQEKGKVQPAGTQSAGKIPRPGAIRTEMRGHGGEHAVGKNINASNFSFLPRAAGAFFLLFFIFAPARPQKMQNFFEILPSGGGATAGSMLKCNVVLIKRCFGG